MYLKTFCKILVRVNLVVCKLHINLVSVYII